MEQLVEYIRLRHNSAALQQKLESLGYYGLPWTIDKGRDANQIIVVCTHKKRVPLEKTFNLNKDVPMKEYVGSFWNNGINTQKLGQPINLLDCGDDEEMFLKYAERMITDKDVFFDVNWENEVPVPAWWTKYDN